jgi:hypothetical protein
MSLRRRRLRKFVTRTREKVSGNESMAQQLGARGNDRDQYQRPGCP